MKIWDTYESYKVPYRSLKQTFSYPYFIVCPYVIMFYKMYRKTGALDQIWVSTVGFLRLNEISCIY